MHIKSFPIVLALLGISFSIGYLLRHDPTNLMMGLGFMLLGLGWHLNKGLLLAKKNLLGSAATVLGLAVLAVAIFSYLLR